MTYVYSWYPSLPTQGFDPPFAEDNKLLNDKVAAPTNQATTAGLIDNKLFLN